MNVKITNKEIVSNIGAIANLAQKDLPVKASYAIGKNKVKLDKLYELCEAERVKLVNKYGPKDENKELILDDNGLVHFTKENIPLYNDAYKELLEIENDVEIHQFKLEVIENYNMKADELTAIDCMLIIE